MKGKCHTEETKRKMVKNHKGMLGQHHSEKTKRKISKSEKGKTVTKETKKKMSKEATQRWLNPEYREKVIKNTLKGLLKRPTSLEKQMLAIIEKHSLPYRYTGDGSFLIGFKNPDFVNTNGQKICIEVHPRRMCKYWGNQTPDQYHQTRTIHFKKWGWKCLVFFDDDLKNEEKTVEEVKRWK